MTTLAPDMPCSHPSRRGKGHETYTRDGRLACRACGAEGESSLVEEIDQERSRLADMRDQAIEEGSRNMELRCEAARLVLGHGSTDASLASLISTFASHSSSRVKRAT